MGLRIVNLSVFVGSARRIEVSQRNKLQTVTFIEPAQHTLECQFRFAIWVDWYRGIGFGYGGSFRYTVGSGVTRTKPSCLPRLASSRQPE